MSLARTGKRPMDRPKSGENQYGLTDQHEAYCQLRAQGVARTDAYRQAVSTTPDLSDNSARVLSYRLERLDKIRARLAMLQEQAEAQALMTTQDIQAKLTEIATDEDQPVAAQLKAMDQLAKIQGAYETKIELTTTITLSDKEAAAKALIEDALGLTARVTDTDATDASGEEDV